MILCGPVCSRTAAKLLVYLVNANKARLCGIFHRGELANSSHAKSKSARRKLSERWLGMKLCSRNPGTCDLSIINCVGNSRVRVIVGDEV